MKIVCNKERLNFAVQTVQKAVATKTPLPILTGIYISAKNGKLELQATDYEIGISCTIDADIYEEGNTVLSGKYLQEMVKKLPGNLVTIETSPEDRTIKITSNAAQFNLLSMPPEEFPILKQLDKINCIITKDVIIKDLIKKTVFACANDEARPIFTGGLLETKQNYIRLVATNTHRLALKTTESENNLQDLNIIIPAKILNELARTMNSDVPVDVTITWHKNQVAFSFDGIYIVSRLIEGQFPDYTKVIPQNFATNIIIDSEMFFDAVERVALLSRDGDYNIIKFNFQKDCAIITSNNPDIGKACETLDILLDGNEIEIAFNAKYITDILKNIDSDKIKFSLNTPVSPACIRPLDDESYTYVITPVRTN